MRPAQNASQPLKALIVGAGIAGTTCAAQLASITPANIQVVLIDPQPALKTSATVSRITRTAIDVQISEQHAVTWCQNHGITFIRDHAIHLTSNCLHLQSGLRIPFATCCIATGARPYVPPVLCSPHFRDAVLTLRDTDSVDRLKRKLKHARRVIVLGAGGIAMELVHEIDGCEVVWVIKSDHIGGSFFDKRGATAVANAFQLKTASVKCQGKERDNHAAVFASDSVPNGSFPKDVGCGVGPEWLGRREGALLLDRNGEVIRDAFKGRLVAPGDNIPPPQIKLSCEITSLRKDKSKTWSLIATLSDGTEYGCDFIVAGTGVIPNIEWLSQTNIQIAPQKSEGPSEESGGIVIEAGMMETSMKSVYAAGDCTYVRPELGSDWFQMRLWTQALSAGRAAAQGMACRMGIAEQFTGLEFDVFGHVTQFFGKRVVLLGNFNAQGLKDGYKMYERGGEGKEDFLRVVVDAGRVRGAVLVGDVDCAEVFENLILSGIDVSWMGVDIVNPDVDLEDFFD